MTTGTPPAGTPPETGTPPATVTPPASVTARPRKATKVAWVMAGLVLVIFSAVATGLHGVTDSGTGVFHTDDQFAMIGLGVLGALGILLMTRPRVWADAKGIRIRNILGGYDLPWAVVRSIRFIKGSPWASLELQDDDVVSVMAVQAADKQYAVATLRGLRALLAAHQAAPNQAAPDQAAPNQAAPDQAAAE